jgi:hypothetical protein
VSIVDVLDVVEGDALDPELALHKVLEQEIDGRELLFEALEGGHRGGIKREVIVELLKQCEQAVVGGGHVCLGAGVDAKQHRSHLAGLLQLALQVLVVLHAHQLLCRCQVREVALGNNVVVNGEVAYALCLCLALLDRDLCVEQNFELDRDLVRRGSLQQYFAEGPQVLVRRVEAVVELGDVQRALN